MRSAEATPEIRKISRSLFPDLAIIANQGWLISKSPKEVYRPRFFRLQPSFISITLVPTNYPSPASIPAYPAVSCLAPSSRLLPHNHAQPTVSRTVAHLYRLFPFRFDPSLPSRPAFSIHHSSPPCLLNSTRSFGLQQSATNDITCRPRHSHDHSSRVSAQDSSSIVPHVT